MIPNKIQVIYNYPKYSNAKKYVSD